MFEGSYTGKRLRQPGEQGGRNRVAEQIGTEPEEEQRDEMVHLCSTNGSGELECTDGGRVAESSTSVKTEDNVKREGLFYRSIYEK